jgi:hypothetical protein
LPGACGTPYERTESAKFQVFFFFEDRANFFTSIMEQRKFSLSGSQSPPNLFCDCTLDLTKNQSGLVLSDAGVVPGINRVYNGIDLHV